MVAQSVTGLVVATLGGAAIGLERQWSGHATGPHARLGGIRTFTLLGGVAGISGWCAVSGLAPLGTILLATAAALVVVGYVVASRADVDATTEAAALVVLAAGALAGAGHVPLASAIVAATALLLLEKTRVHALVARIDDASLRASARFAAMALVILPLLPAGPYGPHGAVRPREVWAMVLFFSGLSFAGWIARRFVGAQHGVIVSGLLGGTISSTSVTLRFARDSRASDAPRLALAAGATGACTVMLLRVVVAALVLNPGLAIGVLPQIAPAFAIGAIVVLLAWRRSGEHAAPIQESRSPLDVRSALQMAGLFQIVLLVIVFVQARWGTGALVPTSMFVALTDLDALTLSLARTPAVDPGPAVVALAAGIVSNTILKLGVALIAGRGVFRLVSVAALGLMAAAIAAALLMR